LRRSWTPTGCYAVISSSQLPHLSPGAHLQVQVQIEHVGIVPLRDSLPNLPDLTWEDIEEAAGR
jgi:hypothetical protein